MSMNDPFVDIPTQENGSGVFLDGGIGVHGRGMTAQQHRTSPQAWDHIDQQDAPEKLNRNIPSGIATSIDKAMPVHFRSPNRLRITSTPLLGSITAGDVEGPFKLVDRQMGRRKVSIMCPAANTKGCYISHTPDDLSSAIIQGWLVEPGAKPLDIETEAAIWCQGVTGNVAADVVQIIVTIDVPDSSE